MEEETDSTGRGSSAYTTQPKIPRAFCRTCGRRIAPPRRYTSAVGVVDATVLPMILLLLLLPRPLHASISPLLAAHTLHSHPSRPRPRLRPSHRSHRQIQCRASVASPPESQAQTTTWKTTTATQPGHDGRCARSRRRPMLHRETLPALRGSEKVYTSNATRWHIIRSLASNTGRHRRRSGTGARAIGLLCWRMIFFVSNHCTACW